MQVDPTSELSSRRWGNISPTSSVAYVTLYSPKIKSHMNNSRDILVEAHTNVFRIVRSLWNFDRHRGITAADVPVKFQSDAIIQTTNLTASRLNEILR